SPPGPRNRSNRHRDSYTMHNRKQNGKPRLAEWTADVRPGSCFLSDAGKVEDRSSTYRPGPQGFNQIAGSLEEQLERVHRPQQVRPVSRKMLARILVSAVRNNDLTGPVLERLIAKLVARMVAKAVRKRLGGHREGP